MTARKPANPKIDFNAVTRLLEAAVAEGRNNLLEHEVYQLLAGSGCGVAPKSVFLPRGADRSDTELQSLPGEQVVLKIAARSVIHKNAISGVRIIPNTVAAIRSARRQMLDEIPDKFIAYLNSHPEHTPPGLQGLQGDQLREAIEQDISGVLAVQYVARDMDAFNHGLLVGITYRREFGMTLSAGLGGSGAELFAHGLRSGRAAVSASTELTDAGAFLDLFRNTIAYRKLQPAGVHPTPAVADESLIKCFSGMMEIANYYSPFNPDAPCVLETLEFNPLAFVDGMPVPLDGVCRIGKALPVPASRPVAKIDKLLHPQSIGIIGVSATKMNFGRIILKNIINSGYDTSRMRVIKPGDDAEIDGVKCVPDLKSLDHKLDLFVVAVSADVVFGLVDEVIETNAAETVMLIPGGLGETQASREPVRKMIARMQEAHRNLPDGGPLFLGGNCLGVMSHPGKYDSWFIPQERLPRPHIRKRRNSAFISQSGAFMITRLSKNPWLDPAYMIATGNQNDISHSDMINYFADHAGTDVIGLYIEGFKDLDGLAFAKAVRRAVINGKDIIVYKAGQTAAGKTASIGHTASIAGDYEVCVSILTQAGAMVAREFSDFGDLFYAASYLHDKKIGGNRLGAVSGAGFETVGMADNIRPGDFSMEMAPLEPATLERLGQILKAKKLDALMEVRNPFDINPGADDEAHLDCTAAFALDPNVDAVVVGMDPISPMIMSLEECSRPGFDLNNENSQVNTLPKLVAATDKPIIGIIEGGTLYDAFAARLMDQEVCIFRCCERGVHALVHYVEGRLNGDRIRKQ